MRLSVSAYTVPTDAPESDGTFEWDKTTLVAVEIDGGLGWTYAPAAAGKLIEELLAPAIEAPDDIGATWAAMVAAVRNAGPWGLAMYAISAVDIALWDRRARQLGVALADLLGRRHESVEVYGSGGFCSYSDAQLSDQLSGWAQEGFARVKMKIGRGNDEHRVAVARAAIGDDVELMVDGNGAYDVPAARRMATEFTADDVRWFEEPVSSDDPDGLRSLRGCVPGMAIAAGEYATSVFAANALLGSVDVLQADVTRCGGITGFMRMDGLCAAHDTPLSAHCAPALSAHAMAATQQGLHIEYFHDHARIESLLFDGALEPQGGALTPDRSCPGHGMSLRRGAAERYCVAKTHTSTAAPSTVHAT
jgi:L-alanine-DL-glutamate epimerase-like enolase superfamily enzyme